MASNDDDVLDFQAGLVRKLKSELSDSRQTLDDIIRGSRVYWQRVQSVHQAALLLMEARDLKQALAFLQNDVARLLGMECVQLFLARGAGDVVAHSALLLRPPPPSFAGLMEQPSFILQDAESCALLFGGGVGPIASATCLVMDMGGQKGLLALGSRHDSGFGSGQALEPYLFLAGVIERMGPRWLAATNS